MAFSPLQPFVQLQLKSTKPSCYWLNTTKNCPGSIRQGRSLPSSLTSHKDCTVSLPPDWYKRYLGSGRNPSNSSPGAKNSNLPPFQHHAVSLSSSLASHKVHQVSLPSDWYEREVFHARKLVVQNDSVHNNLLVVNVSVFCVSWIKSVQWSKIVHIL
jgi:hypothetical protein